MVLILDSADQTLSVTTDCESDRPAGEPLFLILWHNNIHNPPFS